MSHTCHDVIHGHRPTWHVPMWSEATAARARPRHGYGTATSPALALRSRCDIDHDWREEGVVTSNVRTRAAILVLFTPVGRGQQSETLSAQWGHGDRVANIAETET